MNTLDKALFITFHGFNASNGISKKIHYQVHALEANGLKTHLCYVKEENNFKRRMIDNKVIASYGNGLKSKIYKRCEFNSIVHFVIQNQINFVYIRSDHNANPFTIHMIRKMKKAGVRIVMEIPTYPYDQEYTTRSMKIQLFIDRCFRNKLARLLDKIITFSNYNNIFGCPTLQISNGIDFNEVLVKSNINDTSRELHLIGVAEIHFWHGYDRLLKGLAAYYSTHPEYKVYFHIVGEFFSPREYDEIMSPMTDNHLQPYVIFHGAQHGENLNILFDQADMGIGSLGRHRSGITHIKTLKNREYAARGIPFIYSETDEDFENRPYIMKAPADETPIDIHQLILFHKQLNVTPSEIRNSIQSLSWENQIKKILQAINEEIYIF